MTDPPEPLQRSQPQQPQMKITATDLRKFQIAYSQQETSEIKSLDFSHDGLKVLFNTESIIKIFTLTDVCPVGVNFRIRKHGAKIVKFMRSNDVLHTSVTSDIVRLQDKDNGNYKLYFPGHTKEVHSLSTARFHENYFATGSQDGSMRFWDSRISKHQFMATFTSAPLVAMHPSEKCIAVAYRNSTLSYLVEIFDTRKTSLKRFEVESSGFEWCDIRYSNNGRLLMANTNDSVILVIDMTSEEVVNRLRGISNPKKLSFQSCFTPDSQFVISGSEKGIVHMWNLASSEKEVMLKYSAVQSFLKIEFNPQYMCFGTIGDRFNLWIETDDSGS